MAIGVWKLDDRYEFKTLNGAFSNEPEAVREALESVRTAFDAQRLRKRSQTANVGNGDKPWKVTFFKKGDLMLTFPGNAQLVYSAGGRSISVSTRNQIVVNYDEFLAALQWADEHPGTRQ